MKCGTLAHSFGHLHAGSREIMEEPGAPKHRILDRVQSHAKALILLHVRVL